MPATFEIGTYRYTYYDDCRRVAAINIVKRNAKSVVSDTQFYKGRYRIIVLENGDECIGLGRYEPTVFATDKVLTTS